MKKLLSNALLIALVILIGCDKKVTLEKQEPFSPPKAIEEQAKEANLPLKSLADDPVVSDVSDNLFTISAAAVEPKTITLTLNVIEEPNFFLSVVAPVVEVYPNGVAVFDIAVSVVGGYDKTIRFALSPLPTGFSASFNPTELKSGTTRLSIQIPSNPTLGAVSITVTATEII